MDVHLECFDARQNRIEIDTNSASIFLQASAALLSRIPTETETLTINVVINREVPYSVMEGQELPDVVEREVCPCTVERQAVGREVCPCTVKRQAVGREVCPCPVERQASTSAVGREVCPCSVARQVSTRAVERHNCPGAQDRLVPSRAGLRQMHRCREETLSSSVREQVAGPSLEGQDPLRPERDRQDRVNCNTSAAGSAGPERIEQNENLRGYKEQSSQTESNNLSSDAEDESVLQTDNDDDDRVSELSTYEELNSSVISNSDSEGTVYSESADETESNSTDNEDGRTAATPTSTKRSKFGLTLQPTSTLTSQITDPGCFFRFIIFVNCQSCNFMELIDRPLSNDTLVYFFYAAQFSWEPDSQSQADILSKALSRHQIVFYPAAGDAVSNILRNEVTRLDCKLNPYYKFYIVASEDVQTIVQNCKRHTVEIINPTGLTKVAFSDRLPRSPDRMFLFDCISPSTILQLQLE